MTCLFTAYFVCVRRVGKGREGEVGGTVHLLCVFLLGGGGDLLWCTMFSFERGSSALKKKSFYPHISHQFSLPSVARLCGLT